MFLSGVNSKIMCFLQKSSYVGGKCKIHLFLLKNQYSKTIFVLFQKKCFFGKILGISKKKVINNEI